MNYADSFIGATFSDVGVLIFYDVLRMADVKDEKQRHVPGNFLQ